MKFLKRGVALALLAAFALTTQPAQAYEKDKNLELSNQLQHLLIINLIRCSPI